MPDGTKDATGAKRVVLFIGGSLMPFCRFRRALIEDLLATGDCRVVCAYWGDEGREIFSPYELDGLSWSYLGGDHAAKPGPADLVPLARLAALLRRTRPDTVCCFNAKPIALTPHLIRMLCPKARIVALMEGLGMALSFLLKPPGAKSRAFQMLTRPVNRWVLLNDRDAEVMAQLHPRRAHAMHVIPGIGVNIDTFRPVDDPLSNRRLIFVGRLVPEKGIYFFRDLARYLKERGLDWQMAIAGLPVSHGGVTQSEIDSWIAAGDIESCGPVQPMRPFYEKASMLVFPSTYEEGRPAVIMEAQACGLPCLLLDRPALRGSIIDGETGALLAERDPALWYEAIAEFSEPQRFAEASATARRFAEQTYDERRINARLAALLLLRDRAMS